MNGIGQSKRKPIWAKKAGDGGGRRLGVGWGGINPTGVRLGDVVEISVAVLQRFFDRKTV